MKRLLILSIMSIGCGGHQGGQELGPLTFDVPANWARADTHSPGAMTALFTPALNARKETIMVTRTELFPNVAGANMATIARYLEAAQGVLSGAKVSVVVPVSTDDLAGVRLDVDFTRPGTNRSYHRIHAVFAEHNALVHVVYTAVDPDPTAFDLVIRSLHEES